MKILVVEDDKKVRSFLERGFEERGYAVDSAPDGREGLFLAEATEYDCIVLDVMMPKFDGFELVRLLRTKGLKTPVIFLTAKDSVDDRVKGLELGGDDYLVKPFAFSELLARVQALVRRRREEPVTRLVAGDLVMDITKRTVSRGGKPVELTPKEFTLLQHLLERKGEVVTRTAISENVWGYHFDPMSNVIDVHITTLRKKIDLPGSLPLIQTIRGVGYSLKDS